MVEKQPKNATLELLCSLMLPFSGHRNSMMALGWPSMARATM